MTGRRSQKGGLEGVRVADDELYLREARFDEPKESFKFLRRLLSEARPAAGGVLADLGCATGELIYYLAGEFPALRFHGIDISEALIARARQMVPAASFATGSLDDPKAGEAEAFEYCTMSGVLCCFDDPLPVLANTLRWLKPGGTALIFDAFNDYPVDVILRYRRADRMDAPWEKGWNVFARQSIDRFLGESRSVAQWDYLPFRMPIQIEKRGDPMRTWTIETADNPHQIVNGASQLVDLSVLRIRKAGGVR
jgi:SAM-dependent methyltransferase